MFGLGKKKDDDFLLENEQNSNLDGEGKYPPPQDAFKEPTPLSQIDKPTSFQDQNIYNQTNSKTLQSSHDKQEVILAKLDSIKSMLDLLNQRMTNLENKISNQNEKPKW